MTQRAGRLSEARQGGSLAAARELQKNKLDLTRAVDVFQVIVDADLWLLFRPLDKLLGAYVPNGGGILINARRPRALQRLTAAHEYGHHVLRHEGSADLEELIQSPNLASNPQEAAAQAFAMDFLMPVRLVNVLWKELSIPAEPQAYHVYLLSLYLGTSYTATLYQLAALDRISSSLTDQLLKISPKQVKEQIGRGIGPGNSWAEIWPLDSSHHGRELVIAPDDEVRICLPESPSTGYVWVTETAGVLDLREPEPDDHPAHSGGHTAPWSPSAPTDLGPDHVLGLVRSEFEAADSNPCGTVGGGGHRYFRFRALRSGTCELHLALRRPWLGHSRPDQVFRVNLRLLKRPSGDEEAGFFDDAKPRLAVAA